MSLSVGMCSSPVPVCPCLSVLSRSAGAVALFLIQRNSDALVGRTMHPQRLKEIVDLLESDVVIQ